MKKKILIVEDNPEMLALEKELLENAGYEVLEATTARDGVVIAAARLPDLILMDIRLPSKKRGIGAAKLLRKEEATRNIPIIFVSAYAGGMQETEIKNIENYGYILKPFHIEDFLKTIKEYIA